MSLENLNKDILMHLSQYIEETPEEWEIFKHAFDKNGEITDQKRKEVLNRKVWIEIHIYEDISRQVLIEKIYFSQPDFDDIRKRNRSELYEPGRMEFFKLIVIEKTFKDLFDHIIPEDKVAK